MKHTRMLALLLAAVMLFALLTGCAAKQEPAQQEPETTQTEDTAAQQPETEEPAQEDDGVTIPIQSGNDVPNVNPVQDKTEPVKLTEDGKVDPTTIAKAEDFGDWEEETGCRG